MADEILKDNNMQNKINEAIASRLSILGLATADGVTFRDSLQKLVFQNNPSHLISQSNKELQQQTLDMVQKLSKDLYFEID